MIVLSEGGTSLHGAPALSIGTRGSLMLNGLGRALPFAVRSVRGDILGAAFQLNEAAAAALQSTLDRLAPATGGLIPPAGCKVTPRAMTAPHPEGALAHSAFTLPRPLHVDVSLLPV